MSDTLSLIVFAICVSTFHSGFSVSKLLIQIVEIGIFIPVLLITLSRLGSYFLRKVMDDEDAYFILMVLIMVVAAGLAELIDLPDIVGAFLAGLAVNTAAKDKTGQGESEISRGGAVRSILFYCNRIPDRSSKVFPQCYQ